MAFTYKSYNFVDKDPIIDQIRTVVQNSGATWTFISECSGVSKGTLSNWFYGDTKKPQAASVNAVLRALGYKLEIVPIALTAAVKPTPAEPKPTSARHKNVIAMQKYNHKLKKAAGK